MFVDRTSHKRVKRMPSLGVVDGKLQHFSKGHRPEAFEQRDPSAEQPRRHTGLETPRKIVGPELTRVERLGRSAGGVERVHTVARLVVHGHEAVASDTGHHRLDLIECCENGDRRVGGGAALHQDANTGDRRQRVCCGDQAVRTGHRRTMGLKAVGNVFNRRACDRVFVGECLGPLTTASHDDDGAGASDKDASNHTSPSPG